jgi:hypothetical protein
MTTEAAKQHRKETYDLKCQLDDLITESVSWTNDDRAKVKVLSKTIHERISQNPEIYPGYTTSLDSAGGLTLSFIIFQRS